MRHICLTGARQMSYISLTSRCRPVFKTVLLLESGKLGRMRKMPVSLVSLGAIFAYAVYQRGGVHRADWNWCLLALAVLALCFWLRPGSGQQAPAMDNWLAWPVLLIAPYVALQLVPLPQAVLRTISPARARLNTMPRPTPRLPPVTRAFLPARSRSIGTSARCAPALTARRPTG